MVDYPEMYYVVCRAATQAITILQEALQRAEEIYISAEPVDIRVLGSKPLRKDDGPEDDDPADDE